MPKLDKDLAQINSTESPRVEELEKKASLSLSFSLIAVNFQESRYDTWETIY